MKQIITCAECVYWVKYKHSDMTFCRADMARIVNGDDFCSWAEVRDEQKETRDGSTVQE